ncbi:MAG: FtsX-like permease family protein [Lachnospiraceae bacterium]|nr:FtsX-like permease family protein [Lachnospiraceae bacterium]
MKKNKLSTFKIACSNLKGSLARTVGLLFLMTVISFVYFGGNFLSKSLKNGLNIMKERLGADVMIVPVENDSDMEAILLKGEPSCFYFKKSLVDRLEAVEGIERSTSQFFLTSLDAECCDSRVQLIGFDPDTDFSVSPWIRRVYEPELGLGAVIIGNDIHLEEGEAVRLFGEEYPVAARLDATGTGLDQAVYATMETIKHMYTAALGKGQRFLTEADPDNSISSILIRIGDGYDTKEVIKQIRKNLGGVQVVESQSMIRGTADNLMNITGFFTMFEGIFLITLFVTITLVFSISINERKKEFSILRTLGANKRKVAAIVISEACILGLIGAAAGILLSFATLLPLRVFIGDRLGMPYITPGFSSVLALSGITVVLNMILSALSSAASAYRLGRAEVYLTMMEGD